MLENRSKKLESELREDAMFSDFTKNIERDVRERFKTTCARIAELKAGRNAGWKLRARAIAGAIGVSGSRAKTILYDEHRIIHAHEYITAERAAKKLEYAAIERAAVRGMEMGFDALDQVDSLRGDYGGGGVDQSGGSLPKTREIAEVIKLAEV